MTLGNYAIFGRVLFLCGIAAAGGCRAGTRAQVEEAQEFVPGITFEGLEFRSYRGPELLASGEAARATFRRDDTGVAAEEIRALLKGRPGEPDHLVEAPRGTGNLRAGEAHLAGGVLVVIRGVAAK